MADQMTAALDIIRDGLAEATAALHGWSPLNQIAVGLAQAYAVAATITPPAPAAVAPAFPDAVGGYIDLPETPVGQPFTYTLRVEGEQPLTVSLSGATANLIPPAGKGFWNPTTLTIEGTPTFAGLMDFIFLAQNAAGVALVTVRARAV